MNEWMLLGGLGPLRTDVAPGCHDTCHSAVTLTNQRDTPAPALLFAIQCSPVCPCFKSSGPLWWWLGGPERPWQVISLVLLRGFQSWTQLPLLSSQPLTTSHCWSVHDWAMRSHGFQFKPIALLLKNELQMFAFHKPESLLIQNNHWTEKQWLRHFQ